MKEDIPYIRVATDYYKILEQPLASGDKLRIIKPWTKTAIKEDHTQSYLSKIEKYDGFCSIPSHLDYKPIINGFYNQYGAFKWEAAKGNIEASKRFITHIFDDQLEMGFDYLQILLEKPTERLPILCLVSQERNTGKTTFLNWLKLIFDTNMTINTNEDFESRFNSDWANKLLIAIDEAFFDKAHTSERFKNLSTTKSYKTEAKGKDRLEVEFFGKFILCSNNEDSFIKIDDDEVRYWVRKVPTLSTDDVNLLDKLKAEIPALIHYLVNRKLSTTKATRMWFSREQIKTDALAKLVKKNRTFISQELAINIIDKLNDFEIDEIKFTLSDLMELLKGSSIRSTKTQLSDLLKNKWKLRSSENATTYYLYEWQLSSDGQDKHPNLILKKGRVYTFTKQVFNDLGFDEI